MTPLLVAYEIRIQELLTKNKEHEANLRLMKKDVERLVEENK